ncbi:MAG: autotransporter-associated beta strand repeat-containing protein, partial [Akkermansia sp.]|nr:autotransporter-associated beta strand repeat-containing protein [Akkermansia sp.]
MTLSGAKTYTGMTTVNSGTLTLGGGLKSDVTINGGTLNTGSGLTLSNGQDIQLKSGGITGSLTTAAGSSLTIAPSSASVNGTLTLGGGTLNLDDNILNVSGALTLNSRTTLTVSGSYGYGDHTLITAGSINGSTDYLTVSGIAGGCEIKRQGNSLILSIVHVAREIAFPKGGRWENDGKTYSDGDNVTFTDSGKVTVVGTVKPGKVTVQGSGSTTWSGTGSVAGGATLTKTGKGTLTINTANTYTGGTIVKEGTLTVGNGSALGLGKVTLYGGTLKISAGKATVANEIEVIGSAVLNNGSTHSGDITVDGDLLKGSTIKLIDKNQRVKLGDGAVNGTISGIGHVDIDGEVDLTAGKLTAEQVYLNGTLTHAKGWTLTKGQTLTLGGGKVEGNLVVSTGSVLNFNDHTLAAAPELKGGTLDMGAASSISITGSKASVTIDKQGVYVTSKGTILTDDDLDVKGGTVTLTALNGYSGKFLVEGGTLKISTGKATVANEIEVAGEAVLNNGSTHSGDITVDGDLLKGSTIKLIDKNQRVTLKGGAVAGTISGIGRVDVNGSVDITQGKLTAEQVYLNGTLTHAKGWTLTKNQTLTLGGGKVEGKLIVATGSVLDFHDYTLADAPELKGGTLDMGGKASLTITGSKASITLGKQDVYVTSKGTILTDDDLDVKGGTVTLTALNGYGEDLVVEGGTLKISTGKQIVDNDIRIEDSAVLNNGSTHSGDITVNGDLLKGSTIKLIDKAQLVTLNSGAMNGTISGIGSVNIEGSVDITQGKLTAEQVYLNGTLTHAKGWTLTKGQTLTLGGGKVEGNLVVSTGSVLNFNDHTLAAAPELKGGTLDMGAASSISITGSKASVTIDKQGVYVTSKGTILTDDDLDVKGGTVTLTALNGYSGKFLVEGGTLKISTGKATVANEIEVAGEAVLNNGSTHSGDITVNGDLLKGSTVKLIDKNQRVTLKGGAVAGTISGIGRVNIEGSVDITQGKLTAEQVYLNGTLRHDKGWTLTKNQTLTLGGGKVEGKLIVATGSVLDFHDYTLADAPELKGGTLDMGGKASLTITGSKASITLGKQDVYVTSKGTILTDDDLDVKGGTVTLTALNGYSGKFLVEGGTLKISTGKATVANEIEVAGEAVLNNGSTHSGDITVNGDLLKGSTVKLIDKTQRVTLNGGDMAGTISGIGRVDVKGGVDFTQGKLSAEQIYVNSGGRLVNTKAW